MSTKWHFFIFGLFVILTSAAWAQTQNNDKTPESFARILAPSIITEFSELGYKAADSIEKIENFPLTSEQFREIVRTTRVEATQETLFDSAGNEVDALNFPSLKLIRINFDRIMTLMFYSPKLSMLLQLVAHEYLGIAGVDDRDYAFSYLFTELDYEEKLTKTTHCLIKDPKNHTLGTLVHKSTELGEKFKAYQFLNNVLIPEADPLLTLENVQAYLLIFRNSQYAYKALFPSKYLQATQGEFTLEFYLISPSNNANPVPAGVLECKISAP